LPRLFVVCGAGERIRFSSVGEGEGAGARNPGIRRALQDRQAWLFARKTKPAS